MLFRINTTLKVIAASLLVVLFFGVFVSNSALAQFNPEINYQGKLTNSSGVAVADGLYNINFWLVPTSGGATSTAVWSEARTGGNRVQVTNGLFSVMLGEVSTLTGVDFDQELYLAVEIGGIGTPAWDGELLPRKVLGAVPAAFVAETANSADALSGIASSSFLRSDEVDTMTASSSNSLLSLVQNGVGKVLSLFSGVTEVFSVLSNGNVGIGTTTPSQRLSVGATTGSQFLVSSTGVVSDGTWNADAIGGAYGGTGLTSVTQNQLLIGGAGNTWSQVATSSLGLYGTAADSITSAQLLSSMINETGTGVLVFGTSPTFTTQITSPLVVGGTAASSNLSLKSTSGVGTTDYIRFLVGNNGATEAMRVTNNGYVGIGTTTPSSLLDVGGFNTALYNIKTGTLGLQSYGLNNGLLAENSYYINGSGWTRMTPGYASSIHFFQGQTMFNTANTGTGDFTQTLPLKATWSSSGSVALGGDIDVYPNNFTGASMVVLGTGNVGIGTTTPSQRLSVGATTGSQFLVSSTGVVSDGTWNADAIGGAYGGTGLTSVTQNQLLIGGAGNTWSQVATSSLGLSASFTTSAQLAAILSDEVGTGGGFVRASSTMLTSPTLITPDLGTPSAGVLTNATGLPVSTGIAGLGAGVATFLATPSSANLISAVTDETGTGALVFANSPTFTGTIIGASSTFSGNFSVSGTSSLATTTASTLTIAGALRDSVASAGTAGMVLQTTGSGTQWVATSSLGFGSGSLFTDAGASTYLTATGDNLGIGTTTPGSKLTVEGDISTTNNLNLLRSTGSSVGVVTLSGSRFIHDYTLDRTNGSNQFFGLNSGNFTLGSSTDLDLGINNLGVGGGVMANLTTGSANTAFGRASMESLTTGYGNTAAGFLTLNQNTSGSGNTAVGESSMLANTTGSSNSAFGSGSLANNVDGANNSAIGHQALISNVDGSENTAVGKQALSDNVSGGNNTAVGYFALVAATSSNNTAVGSYAGLDITSGGGNTILGNYTGVGITTGSYNTILGANVSGLSSSLSNNIIIADGQGNRRINVDNNGLVGIGTTTPSSALTIAGDIFATGAFKDSTNAAGTAGMVLQTTGSGTQWVATSTLGITGGASTFLGLTDTPSSFTANRIMYTNGAANALIDSADFTYDGTDLGIGGDDGISFGGIRTISASTTNGSLTFGVYAGVGFTNQTTFNNTIGYHAGRYASTTGSDYNNFMGYQAGYNNTGANNNLFGYQAGYGNTGSNVVAIGYQALGTTTAGNTVAGTVGIGYQALLNNTTGSYNTAVGSYALSSNVTGGTNSAFGRRSLVNNVSGAENSAFGEQAMEENTIGGGNAAFGNSALEDNVDGDTNSAFGSYSLRSNTTGNNNSALGAYALELNTTGINNTALGLSALSLSTTGDGNTAVGSQAGRYLTDGTSAASTTDYSVFLGRNTKALTADDQNSIVIGYNANGIGSNTVVLGNDSITTTALKGNVGIGTTTPSSALTIAGDIFATGAFKDSTNAAGTAGMVLQTTGSGTQWVATSSLGFTSGATTFLGLTDTPSSFTANRIMYTNSGATALIDSADLTFNGTNLGLGSGGGLAINNIRVFSASTTKRNIGIGQSALFANLSNGAGDDNIAIGYESLLNNNTGENNIAVGSGSLYSNTNGYDNAAYGYNSMYANNSGSANAAFGTQAMLFNTTGNQNTANGSQALYANTTGSNNVAVGRLAGTYLNDGTTAASTTDFSVYLGNETKAFSDNDQNAIVIGYNANGIGSNSVVLGNDSITTTALKGNVGIGTTTPNNLLHVYDLISFDNTNINTNIGYQAGKNIVSSAQYNTFVGYQSGYSSTTGSTDVADYNTALGYQSLYSNATGQSNTVSGYRAMYSNTTGGLNASYGRNSLYSNTTGGYNAAFGMDSLYSNKTGTHNTALGKSALHFGTDGVANTAIGFQAGAYLSDGLTAASTTDYSVFVGYNSRAFTNNDQNAIVIGYNANGIGSNSVVLGNDSITTTALKGDVGIGTTTPGSKLTVAGDISTTNNFNLLDSTSSSVGVITVGGERYIHGYHSTILSVGDNQFMGYRSGNFTFGSSTNSNLGYDNLGVGRYTLQDLTTGSYNTGVGQSALGNNTTGTHNTAVGRYSLASNVEGVNNVSVGSHSLGNSTSSSNSAVGAWSLGSATSGYGNTALGTSAGRDVTTGGSNTFLGDNTGRGVTTGSYNTIIGSQVTGLSSSLSNNIIIADGQGNRRINVDNNGLVGIGTTTPSSQLTVAGDIFATGAFRDSSNASGTLGMVLQSTGTSTRWVATSTLGITGGASTFLGLTDTPSSFTANRIMYTNSAANALIDSADFTYNGTDLGVGGDDGIAFGGTRFISASTTNDSITFGESAGSTFTSSTLYNVAIGYQAGRYASTTNSDDSNFIGYQAGYNNTGADGNFIGYQAGYNNTVNNVVAIGSQALGTTTGFNAGSGIVAIGYQALFNNTSGTGNLAIGVSSLAANTAGNFNTAVGANALQYSTSSSQNSAFGYLALQDNTTGNANSAFGQGALQNNTTGLGNSSFGSASLDANTTGYSNAAFGASALGGNISGYSNTAFGNSALINLTSGNTNTAIGQSAGSTQTAGSNNIMIGNGAVVASTTGSNQLSIANVIYGGLLGITPVVGIGTSSPSARFTILGTSGSTLDNFRVASSSGVTQFNITSAGYVGIGTTSPSSLLTIAGDIFATGAFKDSTNAAGTAGMVLQTTGSGTQWVATSTLGLGGGSSLFTDGGAVTYLTATGDNLAVGTTSASSKLTVDGNIRAYDGISFGGQRSVFIDSGSNMTFGEWALFYAEDNENVYSNIGIGDNAANNLRSGFSNVIVGFSAGANMATGSRSVVIGDHAAGGNAGVANIGSMVIIGDGAGYDLEDGANWGTFVGYRAGENVTTGSGNTLFGYQAGNNITSGWDNLIIGYDVDAPSPTGANQLNIGNIIFGTGIDGTGTTLSTGNITIGATSSNARLTVAGDSGSTDDTFRVASSSGTTLLNVTAAGLVGIGTTTPTEELTVVGTVQSTTLLGGATNLTTDANGNIIRDPSDQRLKENVETIENALDTVLGLRGVRYQWIDKERFGEQFEVGFIAQEVDELVPEVVSKGGEYWSLNSKNLIAVVVEAIKEIWVEITGQKQKIDELEARIQYLESLQGGAGQNSGGSSLATPPEPEPEPVGGGEEVDGGEGEVSPSPEAPADETVGETTEESPIEPTEPQAVEEPAVEEVVEEPVAEAPAESGGSEETAP